MKRNSCRVTVVAFLVALGVLGSSPVETAQESSESADSINQVLEWNQVFIDTLIATSTANSSSQRLGAILHTAIFDAYNGIERRYTPIRVDSSAPPGASRRAAVIAAAYTAIVGLFPSLTLEQRMTLHDRYVASLAALSDDGGDGGQSRDRGITWGEQVASMVLAWRATDGFVRNPPYPPFRGGLAVGQWRPTGGSCAAMSALGLAFTAPFVVVSPVQFDPGPPRSLADYADDFNSVKALGRQTESTRTDDQTVLAPFWEGNASVHWNQAANQIARAHELSLSDSNRLLAVLNIAMADTAFTIWNAKLFYGGNPLEVTWRPATSIPLADDGNPVTEPDPDWKPLVTTPCHPEYPAGHPSQNGAAATVLLSQFDDGQTFTLTTGQSSRKYFSITQARSDGNNARVWGGMHYPSTVAISDAVGEAVACYVNRNSMLRLRGGDEDEKVHADRRD